MRRALAWLGFIVAAPAWADHPLLTEDTEVLERGRWELELHGERARDREQGVTTRKTELVVKLARGVAENLEAEIELPYLREVAGGDVAEGRGDISLLAKWRFYERNGLSFAVKPSLILPTGRDELGLGAGRARWAAAVAAAYELGKLELLGHVGYTHNRNRIGERVELWHASAAARYAATDALKLVLDVGRDSNPDPVGGSAARELILGAIYELRKGVELGLGIKRGLNDEADDRSLRAGVKLQF